MKNQLRNISYNQRSYLIIFLLGLLYLFFPPRVVTADSYAFAADIKYDLALYRPHHLLYSPIISIMITPLTYIGIEVLNATQIVNALLLIFILIILMDILKYQKVNEEHSIYGILFAGLSFGLWRFAVQNEAYIMAILFSVIASKWLLKGKHPFLIGLMAAFACLIHQVQFWWWLGILIYFFFYLKDNKSTLLYLIAALIVPLVYYIVFVSIDHHYIPVDTYWEFVLHDYMSGAADISFGWKNFLFFGVGIFRSFLELHTHIPYLLKASSFFYIPIILFVIFIVWFAIKNKFGISVLRHIRSIRLNDYQKTHLLIFLLILLFSLFSIGNSEFMVSLPILLVIIVANGLNVSQSITKFGLLVMLVWNFAYGIYPFYALNMNANEKYINKFINKNISTIFIAKDNIFAEQYSYLSGKFEAGSILQEYALTTEKIDSIISSENRIWSNIYLNDMKKNRADYYNKSVNDWRSDFEFIPIDSTHTLYGNEYLYELRKK